MTIHIEIAQSIYLKNKWNIRIGDIGGSTEMGGISEKEVLEEIKEQFKIEKKKGI